MNIPTTAASYGIALIFGGGLGFVWAWAIWGDGRHRNDICACCGLRSGWHSRHTSWCVEIGGSGVPKSMGLPPEGGTK